MLNKITKIKKIYTIRSRYLNEIGKRGRSFELPTTIKIIFLAIFINLNISSVKRSLCNMAVKFKINLSILFLLYNNTP